MGWAAPFSFEPETRRYIAECLEKGGVALDAMERVVRRIEAAADSARVLVEHPDDVAQIRERLRRLANRSEAFLAELAELLAGQNAAADAAGDRLADQLMLMGYDPAKFVHELAHAHDTLDAAAALADTGRGPLGRPKSAPMRYFAGELRSILGEAGMILSVYNESAAAALFRQVWPAVFGPSASGDDVRYWLKSPRDKRSETNPP
jgi:hypothetical protein